MATETKASDQVGGTRDFVVELLYSMTFGHEWLHRKVDSLRLLDGPTNLRRVSLDLTVPTGLAIPTGVHKGLLFLPLSVVSKAPLRAFDATLGASDPLPVADASLNGWAVSEAVSAAFSYSTGSQLSSELQDLISEIVSGPPGAEVIYELEEFFSTGRWRDSSEPLLDPAVLDPWAKDLLYVFSQNFLLAALLQPDLEGKRVILKYRYHWDLAEQYRDASATLRERFVRRIEGLVAPFGIVPTSFEIPTGNSWVVPASYHLELHAPTGLRVDLLTLGESVDPMAPESGGAVAHLVVRPEESELPPSARADLVHLPHGRLWQTAWSSSLSLGFFLTCLLGTGILEAFLEPANRSASSFLSTFPAILLALMSRGQENPLVSRLHAPLRYASFGLAVCFFLTSLCVVAGASVGTVEMVFGVASIYAGLASILTWSGWFLCRLSGVERTEEATYT